jgi:hypothetical protein
LTSHEGLSLYTTVDDELYEEVTALAGQKIVHVEIWEDSLADALSATAATPDAQINFDLDLYLEDGIYFELYGTLCYPTPDSDPLQGLEVVNERLTSLLKTGLWLNEVAVSEQDALVLVLGRKPTAHLYLVVGGWLLEEWDELPDA